MELNFAAYNGPDNLEQSYRMVEVLLQGGVPVDGNAPIYPSPLQTACFYCLFDIVELLIVNGADMNLLEPFGHPILFMAAGFSRHGRGHLDIFNLLIKHGADVSQKIAGGHTILHSVESLTFDRVIMDAVIACGADVDALSDTNDTPLHIAAREGDCKFADFFLQNNASIDSVNDDGLTAKEVAQLVIDEHEDGWDEDMDEEELEEFMEDLFPWCDIIESIEVEEKRREDLRLEEVRQQKCTAVMMGHHNRLGERSIISRLDPNLMGDILKWV
jgi:ankyrin repeat protein